MSIVGSVLVSYRTVSMARTADMKRSPIKSYIATVGLLAAFLSSEQSCAGQASVSKAAALLSNGSTAEAIALLRQILADDSNNVDAHLLLGTTLALAGSRNESIEHMAERGA